jgi:hypothetical protein
VLIDIGTPGPISRSTPGIAGSARVVALVGVVGALGVRRDVVAVPDIR